MKRLLLLSLSIVALLLGACGAPAPESYAISSDSAGNAAPAAAPVMQESAYAEVEIASPGYANPAQPRMVIENAELSMAVQDPQASLNAITKMAQTLGGYVVESRVYEAETANGNLARRANVTIRVPSDRLNEALDKIKADAVEVLSENRSGEDVTDQYVDLESRLVAKKAAEAQLLKIMESTTKAEDTLMVFNQLAQVQSDIEVLKGQMKYLEQASALSAIQVEILAEESIAPLEVAGWKPEGEARDATQALLDFLQGFVKFIIWLVIFALPVLAILLGMFALLWRLLRWFWKKLFPPRQKPPLAPPPAAV